MDAQQVKDIVNRWLNLKLSAENAMEAIWRLTDPAPSTNGCTNPECDKYNRHAIAACRFCGGTNA